MIGQKTKVMRCVFKQMTLKEEKSVKFTAK